MTFGIERQHAAERHEVRFHAGAWERGQEHRTELKERAGSDFPS